MKMENGARELIPSCNDRGLPQTHPISPTAKDCTDLADLSPSQDNQVSSHLSQADMRGKILELETTMKSMPEAEEGKLGRIEIPTFHHFAPGVYMREIQIPKGSTVVGMIHKTEHLNILSKGRLRLATEDGVREVEASMVVKSTPGTKRAAFALEDSVWITVHANPGEERDTGKLWDMFVTDRFDQLERGKECPSLE